MADLINGRTPEEIKRVLKWKAFACGDLDCNDCSYYDVCSLENRERALTDALAYIEQLEFAMKCEQVARTVMMEEVPKWIKVEEKLPPDREKVIVVFYDGFMTLGYKQNEKWYVAGALYEQYGIEYWMPLPEPPEEIDNA